jgi:hypothetical protein
MIKWEAGRQNSGYLKKLLYFRGKPLGKIKFIDVYLLKWPIGSFVKKHVDTVQPGEKHYRCNIFLWKAKRGGHFECYGPKIVDLPFMQVFRPDIHEHEVTLVTEGVRFVLSIGWVM